MGHLLESRARSTFARLVVLGILAFWVGCTNSPPTPIAPEAEFNRTNRAAALPQSPDLAAALRAQERYGASLMRISGVVGHGVGVDDDGNPTITIFTMVPRVEGIPSRLEQIPTRTVVSGPFVAGALTAGVRPADSGYSIGHPDITAGTLGAIVQDGGGVCHVLSNNHVLANSNDASIGDSALQPGPYDGGSDPADAIGTLADFQPILFDGSPNTIDAAIAAVFSPADVTAEAPFYAPTSNAANATVGLDVKKVGRTTELTTGEVTEINVTVDVCYECSGPFCFRCKKLARFQNQIGTTDMSEGGDSGSLVVDTTNNPVGLLFAGSSTRTLANPIGEVLTRFGAQVIQPADLSSCTNEGSVDSPPSVTITNPSEGATVSETVAVTADATDDGDVTQVEFFVDGSSIGVDSDGNDGWSASWDTTSELEGSHDVSATATDDVGQTASDTVTVTVDNVQDPVGVTVEGIDPASMPVGTTDTVTITGSGFVDTPSVSFENGNGPAPAANVTSSGPNEISATVTVPTGGPPRNRVWDVRVTNPDGSSGVLLGGFTVTP